MATLSSRKSGDKLPQTAETHMNKVCDICGDIGVVDAITTCSQCQIAHQHAYCMQKHSMVLPTDWICEECELLSETILPKSGANSSGIVHRDTRGSAGLNKVSNFSGWRGFRWEKKVEKGKTKYIPAQEAIRLSSGAKKMESSQKTNFATHRSLKTIASTSGRTPIKPKDIPQKISPQMVKGNPSFGSVRNLKSPSHGHTWVVQQPFVQASKELKETDAVIASTKEHAHVVKPTEVLKSAEEIETANAEVEKAMDEVSTHSPPAIILDGNVCTNVKQGDFDAEYKDEVNYVPEIEKMFLCDHALHACWIGSFKLAYGIRHGDIDDEFRAHPPLKVHRKAYEFSQQMPAVLEFELLPHDIICSDILQDQCPNREDIGLYFFPLTARGRNGNSFLWGMFHHVKMDHASTGACNIHGEDSEVPDMDVDMIGGIAVGKIDRVISKKTLLLGTDNDIPPGFEKTCKANSFHPPKSEGVNCSPGQEMRLKVKTEVL